MHIVLYSYLTLILSPLSHQLLARSLWVIKIKSIWKWNVMISVEFVSVCLCAAWFVDCNMKRFYYWMVASSPAGPRPICVPPMLACSGVKPNSSFGIPYCCSLASYVWRRSSCALHTLASSYCKSWRAAFLRPSSSCNVTVVYASCADQIVLNVLPSSLTQFRR